MPPTARFRPQRSRGYDNSTTDRHNAPVVLRAARFERAVARHIAPVQETIRACVDVGSRNTVTVATHVRIPIMAATGAPDARAPSAVPSRHCFSAPVPVMRTARGRRRRQRGYRSARSRQSAPLRVVSHRSN